MFESTKPFYMTRTVADELSYEHKQVIIKYLFEHYEQLTDYLQIFEFFIEGKCKGAHYSRYSFSLNFGI